MGSSSSTPSWLLLPEAAPQPDRGPSQASSSTWTKLRPGGKAQPVLSREHCSPERFVPGTRPQCPAWGAQARPSRQQAAECWARLGGLFLYTASAFRHPPHLKKWPRHRAMALAHSQRPLPSLHSTEPGSQSEALTLTGELNSTSVTCMFGRNQPLSEGEDVPAILPPLSQPSWTSVWHTPFLREFFSPFPHAPLYFVCDFFFSSS